MSTPPALSWTPVGTASYYNVQLFRHGKKIFSGWPTQTNLQLKRFWRFEHHRFRLSPGRYRWYVWPGYGRRKAAHYGSLIGTGTFTVT